MHIYFDVIISFVVVELQIVAVTIEFTRSHPQTNCSRV